MIFIWKLSNERRQLLSNLGSSFGTHDETSTKLNKLNLRLSLPTMTQDPPESAVKADLNAWVDGSTSQPNSVELASGSSVNPSKRALKRQRKLEAAQQRKQDPEFQAERRKRRKEEKQRRAEKVRDGLLPPKIRNKNERQLAPYRLVVDLSFNHLMTGKEQVSTASQLAICYALNRKTPCPVKMVFTPIESEVKAALDQQRPEWQTGWTGPGRNLTCGSAGQHFSTISVDGGTVPLLDPPYDPANTVYLSADAPETLLTLKEGETYIIGGLVDRNRHKNLCRNEAERLGLRTARLPIDDYFKLTGRKVLAINHGKFAMIFLTFRSSWHARG